MHSICIFVWGWNNVNSFVSVPNILFNSFIISTANYSPLSNTILSSNLCNFYMLSLNNCANSSADVSSVIATKLPLVARKDAILVVCNRLSKMTHFVMKSIIKYVYGLSKISLNFNFPTGTSILFFIL